MVEWVNIHSSIHRSTAQVQKRTLNSNEQFSIHSMDMMQGIMEDIFSSANMRRLAEERSSSLLETESPDHHVTHGLEDLIDVVEEAEASSQQAHSIHKECSKMHTHVMTHHPSHPAARITSLFELVKVEQSKQASGTSLFAGRHQHKAEGFLQKFVNIITSFMEALKKLWAKLKHALTVVAKMLLHVLGNTYLGLGLQANVLPFPSVGPLFQICLDSTGILFGPESAWTVMASEFQTTMDADDQRGTAEVEALNNEKSSTSTASLDDLSSSTVDDPPWVEDDLFSKTSKIDEGSKSNIQASLTGEQDAMMFLEVSRKITQLSSFKIGSLEEPRRPTIEDIPDSSFHVEVPDSMEELDIPTVHTDDHAQDTPEESVQNTQTKSDELLASADRIDKNDGNNNSKKEEEKKKKKGSIKKILLAFKAAILRGYKQHKENRLRRKKMAMKMAGKSEDVIRATMKIARKELRNGIPSGALRMCFNMPMAGIVPTGLRISMALSLKMVKSMSQGVAESYAPYLKRKASELHAGNMIQSMAHGKAERRIGLYMYEYSGAKRRCEKRDGFGKREEERAIGCDDVIPAAKFENMLGFQSADCAKKMGEKAKEDEKKVKQELLKLELLISMESNPTKKEALVSTRKKKILRKVMGVTRDTL